MRRIGHTLIADLKSIRDSWRAQGWRETARILRSPDAPASVQVAKYLICGIAATAVHVAVFVIMIATVLPLEDVSGVDDAQRETRVILANLAAWPFGNLVAYIANSFWVFVPGRHSRLREFALFTLISFLSFLAGLLGGPLAVAEGVPIWLAQTGFVFVAMLANFLCRKFFVYLR